MTKYHVNTKTGDVSICRATTTCPLNPQPTPHFDNKNDAQQWYEQNAEFPKLSTISTNFRKISEGKIGKGYVFCEVSAENVQQYNKKLEQIIGKQQFEQALTNLKARPTGESYHLTILSPKEFRLAKKEHGMQKISETLNNYNNNRGETSILGIGEAQQDGEKTWYLVCENNNIQQLRQQLGLPHKDLHITLGFTKHDIHNVSKNSETLIN